MSWTNKSKKQNNKGKICKYPGCTFHASAKGYCVNHYKKAMKKNESIY